MILLSHSKMENSNKCNENYHENIIQKQNVLHEPNIQRKESKLDQILILLSASLCGITLGMNWIAFPVFYVEFTEYFKSSKFILGGVGSIQISFSQFLGIIVSAPIDIYGCRPVAMCGGAILCIGYVLSSFATDVIYLYISFALIGGTGMSLLNLSTHVIIQQHFDKNRTLATTIAMMSRSMGHLLGPVVLEFLIRTFTWRGAMLIYGGILLNAVAFAMAYHRPRSAGSSPKKGMTAVLQKLKDFSVFKEITFSLFCISIFMQNFNRTGFYHHLPSRMVFYGTSKMNAAWLLTIAFTCALVFRFLFGIIGNMACSNRTVIYTVAVVICGLMSLLLPFFDTYMVVAVLTAIFGGFQGATMLMVNIALVDLFGVGKFARSKALLNIFLGMSSLIATPFSGWLFDVTQNYNIPFIVFGIMGLLSGGIAIAVVIITKSTTSTNTEEDTESGEKQQDK